MKKLVYLILLLFAVGSIHAQDYIINFSGNGASTTVDSVKVENLTQGKSISFAGAETLHLLSKVTSVKPEVLFADYPLKIYPNPFSDNCNIEFGAQHEGMAIIGVYDLIGKEIIAQKQYVSVGKHSFQLSGLSDGVYILQVNLPEQSYSAKLINNGNSITPIQINYNGIIGNLEIISKNKSASTEKYWQYTEGDRLKFTGSSMKYSTVLVDIPIKSKTISFTFIECKDSDGNNYPVVQIGTQIWMGENLKTTKYRNGDPISNVKDSVQWLNQTTGAYCDYKNDALNSAAYGRLYNWLSLKDSRNICPSLWHVANDNEWFVLKTYLGVDNAGNKLKETGINHWQIPNTGTDETGFSALPSGRRDYNASWGNLGSFGYWWSSTDFNYDNANYFYMTHGRPDVSKSNANKTLVGLSVRCVKGDIPIVTTNSISAITQSTSKSGGNVTSDEGSIVTARGVCWSTIQNPTISNNKTTDGSGTGSFTSNLTGLTAGTTYYIRSYATNGWGTSYGNELTFTTFALPTVATNSVSAITQTSATSGGIITNDGGTSVTARGVCWSTTQNPTISNSKTIDGWGTGSFTSSLTGLTAGTTYYVRAYATNNLGTAYGKNVSFVTNGEGGETDRISDIDGNIYNTITIGSQTWMKENLKTTKYNDGIPIPNVTDNAIWISTFEHAYCWYNNDISNKEIYGALYNYYAVSTEKLCPYGWHVPNDDDWKVLEGYLGMSSSELDKFGRRGTGSVGNKLKEGGDVHWLSPSSGPNMGTNESGFTALPGGVRYLDNGAFWHLKGEGFWWGAKGYMRFLTYDYSGVTRNIFYERNGLSVRCIKD